MSVIGEVRRLFASGSYAECIAMCAEMTHPDDEIRLITALSNLSLAQKACESCTLATARNYLPRASASAAAAFTSGIYPLHGGFLTKRIRCAAQPSVPSGVDRFRLLPRRGGSAEIIRVSERPALSRRRNRSLPPRFCDCGMIVSPVYRDYLTAKRMIADGQLEEAAPILKRAAALQKVGFFTKYRVLDTLESCAGAVGDYKAAYQYSTQKVHLLELFSK